MDWLAIHIETSSEAVEAVSNFLLTAGAEGVQIDDAADPIVPGVPHREAGAMVTGFFAPQAHVAELQTELQAQVDQLPGWGLAKGPGRITQSGVNQSDWATAWQQYYQPVRVTRWLTVAPAWADYSPAQSGELVIRLDPGLAFGTGSHPTTQLMLQMMETIMRGGETVLDVGTGSGILALAATFLGSGAVIATDVDDVAVTNAKKNLAFNQPPAPITVRTANLLTDVPKTADLILANILADVLVPLIAQVPAHLNTGGHLILSGIYHDQVATVTTALTQAGLTPVLTVARGDWRGMVCEVQG